MSSGRVKSKEAIHPTGGKTPIRGVSLLKFYKFNNLVKVSENKISNDLRSSHDISTLIVPYSRFCKNNHYSEFVLNDGDLCIKENELEFKNILKQEFIDALKEYGKNFKK